MKGSIAFLVGWVFIAFASAFAATPPLSVSDSVPLRASGTFFDLMNNTIRPDLNADYSKPFQIENEKTVLDRISDFYSLAKLESQIKGGEKGLEQALAAVAGKTVTEDKVYSLIMKTFKSGDLFVSNAPRAQSRLVESLVPVIGLASGKGVLVQLDRETYCYNYGYAKGSEGKDPSEDDTDRRTGRSYGASASRNAYDPTDEDYLRELGKYLAAAGDPEVKTFYTAVFDLLLKTDTSKLHELSSIGQTVLADFIAIYMAELDRHLMTGLTRFPWENALTEVTLLAAYSATDRGVTLSSRSGPDNAKGRDIVDSSKLDPGSRLEGFFGVGDQGSGLDGANKSRRHAITSQVVKEQRRLNPDLVARIEKLIRARAGGDVYPELMQAINDFSTQSMIRENADDLVEAVVNFVLSTRSSAPDMGVR